MDTCGNALFVLRSARWLSRTKALGQYVKSLDACIVCIVSECEACLQFLDQGLWGGRENCFSPEAAEPRESMQRSESDSGSNVQALALLFSAKVRDLWTFSAVGSRRLSLDHLSLKAHMRPEPIQLPFRGRRGLDGSYTPSATAIHDLNVFSVGWYPFFLGKLFAAHSLEVSEIPDSQSFLTDWSWPPDLVLGREYPRILQTKWKDRPDPLDSRFDNEKSPDLGFS